MVKGGPYFPTATNAIDAINQVSLKWPTAYAVDLGLGGYWGIFGLQLSGGYRTTGSSDLDVHTFPIILLARARLPLGFVAPYLEGGGGRGHLHRLVRQGHLRERAPAPRPRSSSRAAQASTSTSARSSSAPS